MIVLVGLSPVAAQSETYHEDVAEGEKFEWKVDTIKGEFATDVDFEEGDTLAIEVVADPNGDSEEPFSATVNDEAATDEQAGTMSLFITASANFSKCFVF